MKKIIPAMRQLLAIVLCCKCVLANGQNPQPCDTMLKTSSIFWTADTMAINKGKGQFITYIDVCNFQNISELTFQFMAGDGSVALNLGTYFLKQHGRGFYYLDNSKEEAPVVLGNQICISKRMEERSFITIKKAKISYKTKTNEEKTLTLPVNTKIVK